MYRTVSDRILGQSIVKLLAPRRPLKPERKERKTIFTQVRFEEKFSIIYSTRVFCSSRPAVSATSSSSYDSSGPSTFPYANAQTPGTEYETCSPRHDRSLTSRLGARSSGQGQKNNIQINVYLYIGFRWSRWRSVVGL